MILKLIGFIIALPFRLLFWIVKNGIPPLFSIIKKYSKDLSKYQQKSARYKQRKEKFSTLYSRGKNEEIL